MESVTLKTILERVLKDISGSNNEARLKAEVDLK
jgi:hypothetical protein